MPHPVSCSPCKDRLPDLRRRSAAAGVGPPPAPSTPAPSCAHPAPLAHVLQEAACCRRAYGVALGEQHALLAAARDHQLRLLRQHANIVNVELSDEECERLLHSDDMALFVDNRSAAAGVGPPPAPSTPAPSCAHPAPLAHVLQEVERVRGWVAEVRAGTARARTLLANPAFHTDRGLQEQLDSVVTQCNAVGLKVCGALRQLEAAGGQGGAGGLAGRVARVQAACCRRAYGVALGEQHALLAAARDHQLRLLRQHANIVNVELSDEECERLLHSDDMALFVDNVRADTAAARLALRDAEARHAELRRVEAALCEVHSLFQQLGALVAAQQDALDSVLHCALAATERVGDGQAELLKGAVTRRKTRKKKVGLIICVASGVLLVLVVLIFT